VRQGQDELLAQATGTPYEAAVTTLVDEIETSGLLDAVAAALEGTANLPDLLAAVNLPSDQQWTASLDHLEQLLTTAG
jgi:hypothetical protein